MIKYVREHIQVKALMKRMQIKDMHESVDKKWCATTAIRFSSAFQHWLNLRCGVLSARQYK